MQRFDDSHKSIKVRTPGTVPPGLSEGAKKSLVPPATGQTMSPTWPNSWMPGLDSRAYLLKIGG